MIERLSAYTLGEFQRKDELEVLCGQQQTTIKHLRARVAALEEQLGKNSQNSSLPSSLDGPAVTKPKRRRRRAGKRGHSGRGRQLLPIEQVDKVVECRPQQCGSCHTPLRGDDPAPWRHQVSEIPEPCVEVTEYRRHRLTCRCCGAVTIADLPEGVSHSAFGPRLHALTSLLTGRFLLSKRDAVDLYDVVYGLSLSASSVIAMERRMAEALDDPVAEALAWIRRSPVVHPDETGWRQAKQRAWLWTAATENLVAFRIDRHRSQKAAKDLLGEDFAGAVCSDRYGAYNWIENRGYCWAHLKRDFQAMAERFGSEWYGQRLVASAKRVMAIARKECEGRIDLDQRDALIADERRRIHRILVAARERAPARKTRREAAQLLRTEEKMWTFLDVEGMPPTNNLAERCLRRAVIWRKKCFGTDSEAGSRFVERILSAVLSLRMQQRDVFEFLVQAREANVHGSTPPSLCPTT